MIIRIFWKEEYFCARGLTARGEQSRWDKGDLPDRHNSGWVEPFAKPIAVVRSIDPIALIANHSIELNARFTEILEILCESLWPCGMTGGFTCLLCELARKGQFEWEQDASEWIGLLKETKMPMPKSNNDPKPVEAGEQVPARPHDAGSQANETDDGLDATTEALRHAAEDTPSGAKPHDVEIVPVFDRASVAPKI